MDTPLVIAIVIALAVVAVIAVLAVKRRKEVEVEQRRFEAHEQRDLAEVARIDADRQEADATARAARARSAELSAEQDRLDAIARRDEADRLRSEADRMDPDVDGDGTPDPAAHKPASDGKGGDGVEDGQTADSDGAGGPMRHRTTH